VVNANLEVKIGLFIKECMFNHDFEGACTSRREFDEVVLYVVDGVHICKVEIAREELLVVTESIKIKGVVGILALLIEN